MKGALGCVNCGLSGEKFASVRALGVECETLLPSGDWLNFGYPGNHHLLLSIFFFSIGVLD